MSGVDSDELTPLFYYQFGEWKMTDIVDESATGTESQTDTKVFDADYVKQLREEAKAYRLQAKDFAEKLDAIESERKQQAQKQLEEQGEYKRLADERAAEIERLSAYEKQVQAMIEQATANNAALIEQVPEDKRRLIPMDYDPIKLQSWLANNRDVLISQPFAPPATNGGAGNYQRPNGAGKLSQAEIEIARKMGLTPEAYAASKASLRG